MKAAYLEKPMKIVVRDNAVVPVPGPEEALVKVEYCGVCGSDVHFYKDGHIGDVAAPPSFILGHEVAGTVMEVGDLVNGLRPGDRVALEPGYPCGTCELCRSGKYNLCRSVRFFADPPTPGALQEYVVHPAGMCYLLPETVSTEEGALVEPLAVGLHAASQGNVTLGDRVLILGGGCIGLVTLLAAKARGASEIVVADLFEKRLEAAKRLGASGVISAGKEDVAARVKEIFGDRGADVVFETAGSAATIGEAPFFVKRGGTVVLVGMAAESTINFNFSQIMVKEVTIKSVFRYRNLYPVAIAAIASGSIDVKPIVTHYFSFDDSDAAFRTVVEEAKDVIKAVIRF
ncbi:NAD(P)-dependent alcohol dehydrogenase [Lacrimispora sp. NSJ-141]|uniref:NAD(P)-dependent alcohol dehydrogenase n=1 Tax=Lientehia hominis TaxID=2897778 RepID=A0AAP2W886_9FIRM|nr:NAD(P)-dependent alcohol dehydrogenase [Lientehia hominis]MCD2493213.1 NAD(P)-dependent alcohol dehydrogenase [Lientehia hominis]